jgi:hypothetical protein
MRISQIEYWALTVCDRVRNGLQNEDARVELKREWPDPVQAARRIAGHANAARGDDILWLVGIAPDGVTSTPQAVDLAQWLPRVQAEFDGPFPAPTDVVVRTGDAEVMAVHFETGQAPYAIRNPARNQPGAGPVALEIPWREGTRVRSATREDLLRILVPQLRVPLLEPLVTSMNVEVEVPDKFGGATRPAFNPEYPVVLRARARLYVVPRSAERIVLPVHHCRLEVSTTSPQDTLRLGTLGMRDPNRGFSGTGSATILVTPSEAVINGPGVLEVEAAVRLKAVEEVGDPTELHVRLGLAGGQEATVHIPLLKRGPSNWDFVESENGLHIRIGDEQASWRGVNVGTRYFAWDGPVLHALRDLGPVPVYPGLIDSIRSNGYEPSFGLRSKLASYLAKGREQVFETDQESYRRPVLGGGGDDDQILLVHRLAKS